MRYNEQINLKLYKYVNDEFILQAIIDDYNEISFNHNLFEAGEFTISINYNIPNSLLFERGLFVQFGNDLYMFGEILNITDSIGADGKGSQIRNITGKDARYLFKRRIIKNMNSEGFWVMTAKGELCLRNLVLDQCGENAEEKRRLPIINNIPESANAIGKEYSVSESFSNLYDTLVTIATQSEIGWRVKFNGNLELEVFQGEDLSSSVQFSTDFDSLSNGTFTDTSESFANSVYVAGKGTGEDRDIYEGEIESAGNAPAGLNRFESFDNQSGMTTESEYEAEARSMLAQYGQTVTIAGNGLAKCPYIFKEQYNIGDIITIAFSGKSAKAQVLNVTEHWAFGQYSVTFSFGKPVNDLNRQMQLILKQIQKASNKTTSTSSVKYYTIPTDTEMPKADVIYDTIGFTGACASGGSTFKLYLDEERTGAKTYHIYFKQLAGGKLTLTTGVSGAANLIMNSGTYVAIVYIDALGNVTMAGATATDIIAEGNNQPATSSGVAQAIASIPAVTIDSELSTTSTNPVQNKVITSVLNGKQNTLTPGDNIQINDNVISATDTTYSDATQSAAGLMSAADKTKLDGIEAGAQVNKVTGVKGNSETSYRTGNINITKANIGLGSVANTGDSATPTSGGTTKFTTGGAYTELAKKVDKVDGKGLSTNDFTNTEKASIKYYGTCSTSRATNAKVCACDNFVLETGCRIAIKFTDTAGAAPKSGNITLNVNSTGAKNVYNKNNSQMTYANSGEFRANRVCEFVYDGTNYIWLNVDLNTTYSTITQAEITAGTSTGARLVTPKLLADNFVKKESGKGLSTNDFTTALKTKLEGIAEGAEVNQNAFSNVKVGDTTVAADTKTDTLELVAGNNVTLTPDATNDKVTIAATDTTYESKTAASGGTAVSLVTTGEKYTWNNKQPAVTGGASTITSSNLTASRALVSNSSGKVAVATTTSTELGYVHGVTSAIQTQLNAKVPNTRTINGKALSANVALSASDVGALPDSTTVPTKTSDLTNDSGFITSSGSITGNAATATSSNVAKALSGMVTVSTAAGTAAKTGALNGFTLHKGARLIINLTNANTVANATLNINGTGAKAVRINGYSTVSASNWKAGIWNAFYDGDYWRLWNNHYDSLFTINADNADYASYTRGTAYCTTASNTAAKTALMRGFVLTDKATFPITFTNANTSASALTLNINETGAKSIVLNGYYTSSNNYNLPAGTFICTYKAVATGAFYIDTECNVQAARTAIEADAAVRLYDSGGNAQDLKWYYDEVDADITPDKILVCGLESGDDIYETMPYTPDQFAKFVRVPVNTPSNFENGMIWIN